MIAHATILVLRTCSADRTTFGGFQYPQSGWVEAPDWQPTDECGHGLEGLPWGVGNSYLLSDNPEATWLVIAVAAADCRMGRGQLTGKCKFRRGTVVYAGARDGAIKFLHTNGADRSKCVFSPVSSAADRSPVSSEGDRSPVSSAGDYSMASSAGHNSPALSTGHGSMALSRGHGSPAISTGDGSPAISTGYGSMASSAGHNSPAISTGDDSMANSAGHNGVAVCTGPGGMVRAGIRGVIGCSYWDDTAERMRFAIADVGEDEILADTWYRVNGKGAFVPVLEGECPPEHTLT